MNEKFTGWRNGISCRRINMKEGMVAAKEHSICRKERSVLWGGGREG